MSTLLDNPLVRRALDSGRPEVTGRVVRVVGPTFEIEGLPAAIGDMVRLGDDQHDQGHDGRERADDPVDDRPGGGEDLTGGLLPDLVHDPHDGVGGLVGPVTVSDVGEGGGVGRSGRRGHGLRA